jgi:hypothetical protein
MGLLDEAEAAANAPEPRIEVERALLRMRQNRSRRARKHLARCLAQTDEARAASDTSTTPHENLHAWATTMQERLSE